MPIRNAKYAANFVQRTRRLGSIATDSNAMYVLFGFLDNHSRVYKIFQRVPAHLNLNAIRVIHILTVATKSFVYCSPSIDHEEESCPK